MISELMISDVSLVYAPIETCNYYKIHTTFIRVLLFVSALLAVAS